MITKEIEPGVLRNESGYYVLRLTVEVQICADDAREIVERKLADGFMDDELKQGISYAEQKYWVEIEDQIHSGDYNSVVIAPTNLNVMGI